MKRVSASKIFKERYKKLNIGKKHIAAIAFVFLLSFIIDIKKPFFVVLFSIANMFLLSLDRKFQMPIDIEFSTFSAILCANAFGLKWGIFAAIITKVAAMLYNANIRADHLFMIIGYCMAALLASFLMGFMTITTQGLIIVLILNIYIFFVSKYITNLYAFEIMLYGGSNIIFNMLLFMVLAKPVLFLMNI